MRAWFMGGAVCIAGGATAFLLVRGKPEAPPVISCPEAPVASTSTPAPAAPAVLPHVVDMTDLTPLLDPPARPPSGQPFDADSQPAASVATPGMPPAPDRIPLADDETPEE